MILAIDPGREKCGLALVAADGAVLRRAVVPAAALLSQVEELLRQGGVERLLCGDGTGLQRQKENLRALAGGHAVPFALVDEQHTTEAARRLYWRQQPPAGWRRLWPRSMQTPPVPVDDYVAVLLAWRYLGLPAGPE